MKMHSALAALVALITLVAAWPAEVAAATTTTATVWRCGPDGRVYSGTACVQGRAVEVSDPRSAEQVAAAREVQAADMRRAEAMRRERLLDERSGQGTRAAPRAATAQIKKTALRQPAPTPPRPAKKQAANDGTWRAIAPASPRAPG